MAEDEGADIPPARANGSSSWRELAVARSLDPARARAEKRVQRFLDAAYEVMSSAPGKDFTVQEVVERSGQSLRSFYQYFAGKYELGLALFEESVRSTAEHLRTLIADEDEALERLHRAAVEYHHLCRPTADQRPTRKAPIPLAVFAQELLTEHPKEASQAFVPLVSLFEQLLDEAAEAGAVRPGLRHRQVAGIALQSIMFNAFSATISGPSPRDEDADPADELWELFVLGIGTSVAR
jgi:AcrR family transcriptional regulator